MPFSIKREKTRCRKVHSGYRNGTPSPTQAPDARLFDFHYFVCFLQELGPVGLIEMFFNGLCQHHEEELNLLQPQARKEDERRLYVKHQNEEFASIRKKMELESILTPAAKRHTLGDDLQRHLADH